MFLDEHKAAQAAARALNVHSKTLDGARSKQLAVSLQAWWLRYERQQRVHQAQAREKLA